MKISVSVEVIVPVFAESDDEAVEKALDYLATRLPARMTVIESSAAIVENDDEES